MDKKFKKSQQLTQGAVSTFTESIIKLDKANELLVSSIANDKENMEAIINQIKNLEAKLEAIKLGIAEKEAQIKDNEKLKDALTTFIGGLN